jgi:hypothetical protein
LGNYCGSGCTGTNANIPFTYNSGTSKITVSAGNELYIPATYNYAPAADVETPAMDVQGTYTGGSETLTISGTGANTTCTTAIATSIPLCVGGAFTPTSNTVQYTHGTSAKVAATTFKNLTLSLLNLVSFEPFIFIL